MTKAQPSPESPSEKKGSPASTKNTRINMQERKQTMDINCIFLLVLVSLFCFRFFCFLSLFVVLFIVIVVGCLEDTLRAGFTQSKPEPLPDSLDLGIFYPL